MCTYIYTVDFFHLRGLSDADQLVCALGCPGNQHRRNLSDNWRDRLRHRPWLLQAEELQRQNWHGVSGGDTHIQGEGDDASSDLKTPCPFFKTISSWFYLDFFLPEDGHIPKGVGGGGRCVYLMFYFNLKVFTFWFVRNNIIPGNFGFARY